MFCIAVIPPAQLELVVPVLQALGLGAVAFLVYRRWRRATRSARVGTESYIVGQRRHEEIDGASSHGIHRPTTARNVEPHRGAAPVAATIGGHRRGVAIVLAVFLGSIGAHKFYLGRPLVGLLYAAFAWTTIPTLLSFAEAMIYLFQSDEQFAAMYDGDGIDASRVRGIAQRVVTGVPRAQGKFILVAAALLIPLYAYGTDWPPDEMVAADDVWIVVTVSGWMVVAFVWWMVYGNGTAMLLRDRDSTRPRPTDYSKWRPPVDAPVPNIGDEPGQCVGEELPRV